MRPYHVVLAFTLYCAAMLVAGTVGWRSVVSAAVNPLPHVYQVEK